MTDYPGTWGALDFVHKHQRGWYGEIDPVLFEFGLFLIREWERTRDMRRISRYLVQVEEDYYLAKFENDQPVMTADPSEAIEASCVDASVLARWLAGHGINASPVKSKE